MKKTRYSHLFSDLPLLDNQILKKAVYNISSDPEYLTLCHAVNINASKRLHLTDHSINHVEIVARNSLTAIRLLIERKVTPSIVKYHHLKNRHAELVVVLASLLHDIGMSISRENHEDLSTMISDKLLHKHLDFLDIEERIIVISETLHAIYSHRTGGNPITIEAGIVRVADSLDMAKGRTRFSFREENIDIHSVSAMAIDSISIRGAKNVPIQIAVTMNHTAGIFQIDELLKKKIKGSGIEDYIEIIVYIIRDGKKHLFKNYYRKSYSSY